MRDRALRGLMLAALAAGVCVPSGSGARAQPQTEHGLHLELEPPERIEVGDRARVVAEVRLPEGNELPVLLTPRTEGTPVDVVRGRLLRADAEDPEARVLRFRIPIVARGPGTSVLRVSVLGHACERRCRALRAEASVVLRVERGD